MRKVKCGIENCGNGCGMVGKTRNAERAERRVNLLIYIYRLSYLDEITLIFNIGPEYSKDEHDDDGSLIRSLLSRCMTAC